MHYFLVILKVILTPHLNDMLHWVTVCIRWILTLYRVLYLNLNLLLIFWYCYAYLKARLYGVPLTPIGLLDFVDDKIIVSVQFYGAS